jgi:pyruvate formate lyase activating enzyme
MFAADFDPARGPSTGDISVRGVIFDIQNYALYDGPGIRTTVFLKGCPLRCAWCHNPESWRGAPEVGFLAERCVGCGACVKVCEHGALRLQGGKAVRDRARCTVCGACVAACPHDALETIGREVDVAEVVAAVVRDKPFYDGSGGGVTFTGGEATLQKDFLLDAARACREAGVHVALETCGWFDPEMLPELIEAIDLFLFDVKVADPAAHARHTGQDNARIVANLRALVEALPVSRLTPRVPLIPGANTEPTQLDAIIELVRAAGWRGPVHLMPYNRLARTKWEKIGREKLYRDFGTLSASELDAAAERFAGAGLPPIVNE